MRIRLNELALDTLSYLFMVQYIYWVNGSEFPERECCDTIYSSPPNPEPVQPTSVTPTQIIPSSGTNLTTGKYHFFFSNKTKNKQRICGKTFFSNFVINLVFFVHFINQWNTGTQGKPAVAILSCILARQLCFEDPSCSAILEIIPRVCGPVPGIKRDKKNHHTFYNYFIRCIDIWTCHAWKIRIRTYTDDSIFWKIIFQLHVARLPLQNVWLHSRLCKRFHFSVQHVCVRSPVSIQNVITFKTFYLIIHVDLWGKKVRNYHDI